MEFGRNRGLALFTRPMRNIEREGEDREGFSETEAAPRSDRRPLEPLSRTLWGLDWSDHLPVELPGGVTVHASSYDRALPFISEHYAAIFQEDDQSPFCTSRVGPGKERYYRVAGDFFEFKRGERTVGLLVCTPVDWSTYYIRSAATLPEEHGSRAIQRFFVPLFEKLRALGIQRIEADTSPSNCVTILNLVRMGFVVSGTTLTERWGAQTRLSLFLDDECDRVFVRQFCHGVRYGRHGRSSLPPVPQGLERSAP